MKERRERGLPSLNQAREERRRAIVFGRVRVVGMPPHFWLWTATLLGAVLVIYWRVEQGKLESAKSAVMAKQRAVARTMGPSIFPFRDRVEGWARELSGSYSGDFADPKASLDDVTQAPAVYLRLRSQNAHSAKEIRKAAAQSLRDGFTSCLFVSKAAQDPTKGPPCHVTADCSPGLMCNEWEVCIEPGSPFNMRLAYRTLRVLSTDWTDELHAADTMLQVNAYDRDLDSVVRHDVPIAVTVLKRSKYFTLVLDEDPEGGLPKELPDAGESAEERVQRVGHFARVGIWRLDSGEPVLRVRAPAEGGFTQIGKRPVSDPQMMAAQQRQVNSCALALAVKDKLAH